MKNFGLIAFSVVLTAMLSACCTEDQYEDWEDNASAYNSQAIQYNQQAVAIQNCLNTPKPGGNTPPVY